MEEFHLLNIVEVEFSIIPVKKEEEEVEFSSFWGIMIERRERRKFLNLFFHV